MSMDGMALLAITDDVSIQKVLEKLLQSCTYNMPLHVGKATDAIKAVWDVKESINLILTNVHRAEEVGPQLFNRVIKFDLPIIVMGLPENLVEWKGEEDTEVSAYLLFDLSIQAIVEIWEREMEADVNHDGLLLMDDMTQNKEKDERENTTSINEEQQLNQTKKGKELAEKSESHEEAHREEDLDENNEKGEEVQKGKRVVESRGDRKGRKPRTTWSDEMHEKFVEVFDFLGPDRAYPKAITELMNLPGLTRESVASHLQKYRMSIRKAEQEHEKSKNDTDPTKSVKISSRPPYYLHPNFNTTLQYLGWTTGSPLPTPPLQAHLPAGSGQGPYQQQYYSSLPYDHIISQERINNLLARSQLSGLLAPLQPQPNTIDDPRRNCFTGSQNFMYNQIYPDSLMQTWPNQNTVPSPYILNPNPLRDMNNIPQPHASIQPSGVDGYNAPVEGRAATIVQFSSAEYAGVDDVDFRMLLSQTETREPQLYPETNQDQDPNKLGYGF